MSIISSAVCNFVVSINVSTSSVSLTKATFALEIFLGISPSKIADLQMKELQELYELQALFNV